MKSSVLRPPPPNTYSYMQEENLGSSRKFVDNYLLFLCINTQICALHQQSMDWGNLSKTAGEKVPPAHMQQMLLTYLERNPLGYPAPGYTCCGWESVPTILCSWVDGQHANCRLCNPYAVGSGFLCTFSGTSHQTKKECQRQCTLQTHHPRKT
jgi:hypothetical protein